MQLASIIVAVVALTMTTHAAVADDGLPPLIPLPASVEAHEGDPVQIDPSRIVASGGYGLMANPPAIREFRALLGKSPPGGEMIHFITEGGFDRDAYTLVCDDDGVRITASGPAGHFYGLQTLRQLIELDLREPGSPLMCPRVTIRDNPRFLWRGLHVDSGRHLQRVETLKKLIDEMARHKLNRLHWHLTEDQGWRIPIDAYPKLTEVGGFRPESPQKGNREQGDGTPYGGFYTKDEIRDIVAYAAERFITVMPEIEIPGHSAAALAAYPQFGNTDVDDYDPGVVTRWGVFDYTFSPKPETLDFIDTILEETLELFPSELIHIGGDEAPVTQWERSPFAQQFMREQGYDDPHRIQSWFNEHLDQFLAERGRRMVGWDEILEGPLPERAVVMSWRGVAGGQEAAAAGHDVIMAANSHLYFDYYQSADRANEPEAIGGEVTIEKVYSFDPLDGIDPENHHHILGVQAQHWTEYIWTDAKLEYMAFPRSVALAELAWTPQDRRDWDDFAARLPGHLDRLRAAGVNFRELDGGAAILPVE